MTMRGRLTKLSTDDGVDDEDDDTDKAFFMTLVLTSLQRLTNSNTVWH